MKAWKYRRGEWTEIEDPVVGGENEDWKVTLKRAGYRGFPQMEFGDPDIQGLVVYRKVDYTAPYLINVTDGDVVETVYIDDFPSLLQFLRDFAPFCSLANTDDNLKELVQVLRKSFRGWHGHDADDVCRECDPLEYERRQEFRRQRMESKKQKEV